MSVTLPYRACKTVYPGSIPGVASKKIKHLDRTGSQRENHVSVSSAKWLGDVPRLELGGCRERQEGYERTRMDKMHWTAPVARREVAWRLYVEHELKPRVQFYETKRHLNKASAFKRALAIHRHHGWRLRVLFVEGTSGERIEAAEINDWCERAPPDE
jgi:hypothetical protein